jgi:hypothetical protein
MKVQYVPGFPGAGFLMGACLLFSVALIVYLPVKPAESFTADSMIEPQAKLARGVKSNPLPATLEAQTRQVVESERVKPDTAESGDVLLERSQCCDHEDELIGLRQRVADLELALLLADPESADGALGYLLAQMPKEDRPSAETFETAFWCLRPYPVQLTGLELDWIVERIESDDWLYYGETVDEAIIAFLDSRRIAREVPPEQLERLRWLWEEEGYFDAPIERSPLRD